MSRPKIGIALSAGAARGLCHIGVLKVLQDENIPIDFIAGSSIGSFIGTVYANGVDLDLMKGLAIHLQRKDWLDVTFPGLGFIQGEKVKALVELLTHRKNLEDLPIPTAVIATDLQKGEKVVFREGPIAEAVRASISVPGVFEPVINQGRMLVDGGVVERLPISEVRKMGAEFVIGVDVLSKAHSLEVRNLFDVIMQAISVMERQLLDYHITSEEADVMITPEIGDIQPGSFARVEECIELGEQAARKEIPHLKKILGETSDGQLE